MPKVKANNIEINYDKQGQGEPLILIPYLAAEHACYAFQVADYAKHFTCISIDLPDTGESDQYPAPYTSETLADVVAAFMQAQGIKTAHVWGVSLGGAVGTWLAGKYPDRVKSLSLHSTWPKSDPFLKTVVEGWRVMAKALGSVPEMTIQGIFPWCFTPELYSAQPDYVQSLADFVRSRPAQNVDAFMRQSNAVLGHDALACLDSIQAPTQITFGRYDMVCSTRFADAMRGGIKNSEVVIFEGAAHAAIYEKVEEFNAKTLAFLQRHNG